MSASRLKTKMYISGALTGGHGKDKLVLMKRRYFII